ncbi:SGNH/GDSL hydrolase family protein [Bifidobacterium sp. 82T24]|uniref:SGNH/GDSL hydrolase family protein n=1 Tax=Bifidobacterium pluvialisilvae TaxID=2834436 RepID=UPI001C59275B|nr:SGNH/GDSL hydrolase family protein [Bifidobacterium pluvialisilvae]MBW3087196.1 SGNH/GDSL hydrolase family protein [Bifidobacterium pluvialisilvae]
MNIKDVFHNCMGVRTEPDGLHPVRFPDRLLDFYRERGDMTDIRANATAGITMDFVTSADTVRFDYATGRFCRPFVTFDVYENDVFMATIREPDESPSGTVTYAKRNQGRTRLTFVLPYTTDVRIGAYDFGDDVQPVADERPRMLFLGDSITQGMTSLRPSQGYAYLLARTMGVRPLNWGVGSYVFDARTLDDVQDIDADAIVVAYGTNDYTRIREGEMTFGEFEATVAEYMATLRQVSGGASVKVITPIWRSAGCSTDEELTLMDRVRAVIANQAIRQRFDVIDGLSLVGHDDAFLADGLHPNDLGANMMTNGILRAMLG